MRPLRASTELFALRSFFRFLIAEGLSDDNAAALVTLPSPVRPKVEFYSDPEADAIIEAAAQPGLRWRVGLAMLLTLRYTGLRANEVVTLSTSEVDLDARRISLVGKVRKPRVVPISHLLADALGEYLDEVRPRLPESPYLFANPKGNRKLRGRYGPRALHGLVLEAGPRRVWPVDTLLTAGVTAMRRASSAVAWTSTLCSASWAIPTSQRPRDTCISQTLTFSRLLSGPSRKVERCCRSNLARSQRRPARCKGVVMYHGTPHVSTALCARATVGLRYGVDEGPGSENETINVFVISRRTGEVRAIQESL